MTQADGAPTLSPYISEADIQARILELARQIDADYAHDEDIVLVGVLRGSFIFLADLARRMTVPHHVDFIAVSSYGSGTVSSGVVRLVMDLRTDITDKHVIIVEDIVDTGHTVQYLIRTLAARGPAQGRQRDRRRPSRAVAAAPESRNPSLHFDRGSARRLGHRGAESRDRGPGQVVPPRAGG